VREEEEEEGEEEEVTGPRGTNESMVVYVHVRK
jgi:hypothetical protein